MRASRQKKHWHAASLRLVSGYISKKSQTEPQTASPPRLVSTTKDRDPTAEGHSTVVLVVVADDRYAAFDSSQRKSDHDGTDTPAHDLFHILEVPCELRGDS